MRLTRNLISNELNARNKRLEVEGAVPIRCNFVLHCRTFFSCEAMADNRTNKPRGFNGFLPPFEEGLLPVHTYRIEHMKVCNLVHKRCLVMDIESEYPVVGRTESSGWISSVLAVVVLPQEVTERFCGPPNSAGSSTQFVGAVASSLSV